jgi:hypothetical protein
MSTLGKEGKRLFLILMLLISLSPGCSHSISGGPFPVLGKPVPPLAVTDPRQVWMTHNGSSYALNKDDFEDLRKFIIRQDEIIDIYECQIKAINGGNCE